MIPRLGGVQNIKLREKRKDQEAKRKIELERQARKHHALVEEVQAAEEVRTARALMLCVQSRISSKAPANALARLTPACGPHHHAA